MQVSYDDFFDEWSICKGSTIAGKQRIEDGYGRYESDCNRGML